MIIILKTVDGKEVEFWQSILNPSKSRRESWERREPIIHRSIIKCGENILEFDYDELCQVFNALYPHNDLGL